MLSIVTGNLFFFYIIFFRCFLLNNNCACHSASFAAPYAIPEGVLHPKNKIPAKLCTFCQNNNIITPFSIILVQGGWVSAWWGFEVQVTHQGVVWVQGLRGSSDAWWLGTGRCSSLYNDPLPHSWSAMMAGSRGGASSSPGKFLGMGLTWPWPMQGQRKSHSLSPAGISSWSPEQGRCHLPRLP